MISRTRRGFGFTLVELLVVIAIIGVLVGLLIPAVNYARQTARKGECLNNIRGIGQALMQYESDKESYPGRTEWLRVVIEQRVRCQVVVDGQAAALSGAGELAGSVAGQHANQATGRWPDPD